jgi:hypothetical protein
MLVGRWSCHNHESGVSLVGCWGCGAPGQESPPLVLLAGVLLVLRCPLVHTALIFPIPALTLKVGAGVTRVIPHQL